MERDSAPLKEPSPRGDKKTQPWKAKQEVVGHVKRGLVIRRLAQKGVKRRYVGPVFASVRVLMPGVFPRSCDFCGQLESERVVWKKDRVCEAAEP